MKKIFAFIIASVFCIVLATTAFAAYTLDASGNAVYETAVGFTFKIDDINGSVTGEDSTIVTDNAALANSGSKWAIWFQAKKAADGIYEVITNGTAMNGALPTANIAQDQIIIIVHSASSSPNDAAEYPNWESKVAALAVKIGDYIVLDNIDIENKTSESGTATVVSRQDVESGNIQLPETETETEPETTPEEESSETSEEISVPVLGDSPENADYSDPEIKSSTMKIKAGFWDEWKWWIIGGSVGLLAGAGVVVASIIQSKKKAEPKEEVKEENKE